MELSQLPNNTVLHFCKFFHFRTEASNVRPAGYIRPVKPFSLALGRILKKLKHRNTFWFLLDGNEEVGAPSFRSCLACQIANIR